MVEVRLSAWNGLFGGSANIYVGVGEVAASAEKPPARSKRVMARFRQASLAYFSQC